MPEAGRYGAALADLGHRALQRGSPSAVFADAATMTAATLGVDHASVMELAAGEETLRVRASVGWRQDGVGSTIEAMGDGFAAYALRAPGAVVVRDLAEETRFVPSPQLLGEGVRSSLAVRIPGDGRGAFGVVGAHSVAPRRFTADEVAFLRAVAALLGTTISRQRRAMELNDGVLQGLVVAGYALDAGDTARAREAIGATMRRTRAMVTDLLGDDGAVQPGDLRRDDPAALLPPDPPG